MKSIPAFAVLLCLPLFAAAQAPDLPATRPSLSPSPMLRDLLGDNSDGGEAVAKYDQATLSREQLVDFVLQTRGLDAMLNLMQLQIAKAIAKQEGIAVTPADVEAETRETLRAGFAGQADATEEQYPELLDQLLTQQQLSRAEFDVVMATNTYLKALARPRVRAAMTEENLRNYFDVRYGAQVRVRHIQADNLSAITAAKRRVEAGEEFAKVAAQVSSNADSKRVGGLLPPFGLGSNLPLAFKEAAFRLEAGQMSDPVEAEGAYHLIELEERLSPKAVKFEDVRAELTNQLVEEQTQVILKQLRERIAQMLASENLEVNDPALAGQLRARLATAQPRAMTGEELKQQMEQERGGATTGPAKGE